MWKLAGRDFALKTDKMSKQEADLRVVVTSTLTSYVLLYMKRSSCSYMIPGKIQFEFQNLHTNLDCEQ